MTELDFSDINSNIKEFIVKTSPIIILSGEVKKGDITLPNNVPLYFSKDSILNCKKGSILRYY